MDVFWLTVEAALTLAIFSFLFRDNPVYKFAEYLFVGVSAGWFFATQVHNVFLPSLWHPFVNSWGGAFTGGEWTWNGIFLLLPFILGLLLFTRFTTSLSWLSRWPMALLVGTFSGLAVIGFAQGDLVAQLRGSMVDLSAGGSAAVVSNVILLVGTVATLLYFYFSTPPEGARGRGLAWFSKVGIVYLMISFGASYGFTVMARISLLTDRLRFLYQEWPSSIIEAFFR